MFHWIGALRALMIRIDLDSPYDLTGERHTSPSRDDRRSVVVKDRPRLRCTCLFGLFAGRFVFGLRRFVHAFELNDGERSLAAGLQSLDVVPSVSKTLRNKRARLSSLPLSRAVSYFGFAIVHDRYAFSLLLFKRNHMSMN